MAIAPILVLAATPVLIMGVLAFCRNHRFTAELALAGLLLAFAALWPAWQRAPLQVTSLLIVDGYALFYTGLIIAATFVVAIISYGYLEGRVSKPDEYYFLLLLAALGAAVMVSSRHFVSFFLGLEILSISLYTLIAYLRRSAFGLEAGVKYLVLAAAASAFLLLGLALIYAELGTMDFSEMARRLALAGGYSPLLLAGLGLAVVGIGFKLALVPFHLWTPDVYQGAPAPITAFVATVSKGAMFALLMRFAAQTHLHFEGQVFVLFAVLAIASMFVGNLLALLQTNVKRMLAYSSIAHVGYLLVALLAGSERGVMAATYYLVAYFVMTLGAFAVVTVLSGKEREAEELADYRGLARRRPWLAGVFAGMLMSLAGIPLTVGFLGKFYVLMAGVDALLWSLVIILMINSAIGLFYYLRLALVLFAREPDELSAARAAGEHVELEPLVGESSVAAGPAMVAGPLSVAGSLTLGGLAVLVLLLGVYPSPLIALIEKMIGTMS
jgi:NADH-quinone oxidoreductase subunit N